MAVFFVGLPKPIAQFALLLPDDQVEDREPEGKYHIGRKIIGNECKPQQCQRHLDVSGMPHPRVEPFGDRCGRMPLWVLALAPAVLYLVPPLAVRLAVRIHPLPNGRCEIGSAGFLVWWLTAELLHRITAAFFLAPKRMAVRVVDLLIREHPELAPLRPRCLRELAALENDPAYRRMMYSRADLPISSHLLDGFPELASFRDFLLGPPSAPAEAAA